MRQNKRRLPRRKVVGLVLRYVALTGVALAVMWPFLWMITSSLKSSADVLSWPPTFLPEDPRWENYVEVFTYQPFARQFLNSILVLIAVVAITIAASAMAGYALARLRIRGASLIFLVLLMGIYMPAESTLVPLFNFFSAIDLVDTLTPIVLLSAFTTTGLIATFVMRQSFLGLQPEFGEAATLDGAGRWRIFLQVYLPMVRPSLAAVVVLTAFYTWNSFLYPLIFLRSRTNFTVPLGIVQYEDIYSGPLWGIQLAAATLSVIPVVVVFLLAQKHVVAGLTAGGVK